MFGKVLCIGCTAAILASGGTTILGLFILAASPVGTAIPLCVAGCMQAFS